MPSRRARSSSTAGAIWATCGRDISVCAKRVIADFHDRPIIQLPQTIHFSASKLYRERVELFDAHPNLTLLVRDTLSLELVRTEFRARSVLCPDMAFYVGLLERERSPDVDILWLKRQDRETSGDAGPIPPDVTRMRLAGRRGCRRSGACDGC